MPQAGWKIDISNNGIPVLSHPFTLQHDPASFLGISSPQDNRTSANNQLQQMTQQNYSAALVPFMAETISGNAITWTASLQYATAGGFGNPGPSTRTFSTTSGVGHDETYQSLGGKVQLTAQTTTPFGTMSDCTTFYVEGPESGIPDATITSRLSTLYPASRSYPAGGTPNLMTGAAQHESSYAQFLKPTEGFPPNSDLFSLHANLGIAAKWPNESCDGSQPCQRLGSHIGLMQVETTTADAWNWLTNTASAVDLFSGGPVGTPNKIEQAVTYENSIRNGYNHGGTKCPAHVPTPVPLTAEQRENNALVLYRVAMPSNYCDRLNAQYYKVVCSTTWVLQQGKRVCQNGGTWNWEINSAGQPTGVTYVTGPNPPGVRSLLQ